MLFPKRLEFSGESGKSYFFDVFTKNTHLPERAGIYITTYAHPRGHLAGFQVNVLCVGMATNLESAVAGLREKDRWAKECWNYTCILCIDDEAIIRKYLKDLQINSTVVFF